MKKAKVMSVITSFVGVLMISMGMVLQNEESLNDLSSLSEVSEINIKSMAASANIILKDREVASAKMEIKEETEVEKKEVLTEVKMETAPASVIVPPRVEVYEGMTMDELAAKLNRNLGTDVVAGKGLLIATQCIQKGVDPYVATAILLHETGCGSKCSALTRQCNNVGGQKGAPGCNGGSYKSYPTLDDGIVGFIDNLYRNYYSKGLNTIDTMASRYAASPAWPGKIHWYVNKIRAS